ncbi:MAG: TrmH family RNA methyltransferase [Patescibacteria group bacterium]
MGGGGRLFEKNHLPPPRLKAEGITVVAIEQAPQAAALNDYTLPENVAYIFGNEVDGVQPSALNECDQVVEIPMQGQKESLNVSVTVGIVLFH